MNLSDTIVSNIRTYVPIGVGMAATWAAKELGAEIDTEAAAGVAVGLATGAYYTAARLLEKRWPKAGWLLGRPGAPTYPGTGQ